VLGIIKFGATDCAVPSGLIALFALFVHPAKTIVAAKRLTQVRVDMGCLAHCFGTQLTYANEVKVA
jgi:hypothetical protein